jgi:phage shock protein PspC (stress-responsive transcriptional regulator)
MTDRKLRKIKEKKMIGGVAAGVAYWLGFPTWLVRVVWVFAVLCFGAGLLLYILLWIFMPSWEQTPEDYDQLCGG